MNITKNDDVFCFGEKSFETIYLEYVVLSINKSKRPNVSTARLKRDHQL